MVNAGNKVRNDNVTAEGTSVTIKDKGNQELGEALINPETGIMAAGLQPEVQAANEDGQKNLLAALVPDGKVELVKPKKEKAAKTEKAEPTTLDESMS